MKTLFNQNQHSAFCFCPGKITEQERLIKQRKEDAIAEHIRSIAKGTSQTEATDLTDQMAYYLSVAG